MIKFSFLAILVFLCLATYSQDNHYESLQLGARNSLLTGAGVSKWQDQTAVFNNPATLTQISYNGITFNTAAASISNIKFVNGLGNGYTLKTSNMRFLPALVGGDWKPKNKTTSWRLGYAIYHRNRDKLRFTNRAEYNKNIINDIESPGDESYVAQYALNKDYDETAGVLGIGWSLSEKWSLGASLNIGVINMDLTENFSATVIADPLNNPSVSVVGSKEQISTFFSKAIAQLKLGAAYQHKDWNFGLTLMTPSLGLWGNGEIDADISITDIKLSTNPDRRSYFASARIEKLKPTYKYPLMVGVGVGKKINKVQVYGNINWYAPIEKYVVMDPGDAPFIRPATANNVLATKNFLQVWSVNRNVINGSFALDWTMKPSFHLLFSYALDQSYSQPIPEAPGYQLAKKLWNLNHFNVGFQLIQPKADWIIGIQSAFGKKENFTQPSSFDGPTEEGFLQGKRGTGTVTSSSIGLMLSYSFKFNQK